jgi:hypothetical protein
MDYAWALLASRVGPFILLGRDRILGLGDASFLTPPLIEHLHNKNIWYLYQIRDRTLSATLPDNWLSSSSLGLNDDLATIWNTFCAGLSLAGIHLNDRADLLIWCGGDLSEKYHCSKCYTEIINSIWPSNIKGWEKKIGAGISPTN